MTAAAASVALIAAVPGTVQAQTPNITITEFMASNGSTLADNTGEYVDWVEFHNRASTSLSMHGWTIADGSNSFTFVNGPVIAAGGYVVVFASGDPSRTTGSQVHLPIRLAAAGEPLVLSDPAGTVSSPSWPAPGYPGQHRDVSFGVDSQGSEAYFFAPTPGRANTSGAAGSVGPVSFSPPHGFYLSRQTVTLDTDTAGATIRYTTDGSTPTPNHGSAIAPGGSISVERTTTLRAIAYRSGYFDSPIRASTYLFTADIVDQSTAPPPGWPAHNEVNGQDMHYGMDPNVVDGNESRIASSLRSIPTISITTDLYRLFGGSAGIYTNPQNRGSAWEQPVSVELIDPHGADPGFSTNAGMRIRGGASRTPNNPKHSLRPTVR